MLLSQQKYQTKNLPNRKGVDLNEQFYSQKNGKMTIKEDQHTTQQQSIIPYQQQQRQIKILQSKYYTNIKYLIAQTSQILSYTHFQTLDRQIQQSRKQMSQLNIEIRRLRIGMRNHIYTNGINFTFPIKRHNDQIKVKMPKQVQSYEMKRYQHLYQQLKNKKQINQRLDQKMSNLQEYMQKLKNKYIIRERMEQNQFRKLNARQYNKQVDDRRNLEQKNLSYNGSTSLIKHNIRQNQMINNILQQSKSLQHVHTTIQSKPFLKNLTTNSPTTQQLQASIPFHHSKSIKQSLSSPSSTKSNNKPNISTSNTHHNTKKINNNNKFSSDKLYDILKEKKQQIEQAIVYYESNNQRKQQRLREEIRMLREEIQDLDFSIGEIDGRKFQLDMKLKEEKEKRMNKRFLIQKQQVNPEQTVRLLKKQRQVFYKQKQIHKMASSDFTLFLRGAKSKSPAHQLIRSISPKDKLKSYKSSQNFILKNKNAIQKMAKQAYTPTKNQAEQKLINYETSDK